MGLYSTSVAYHFIQQHSFKHNHYFPKFVMYILHLTNEHSIKHNILLNIYQNKKLTSRASTLHKPLAAASSSLFTNNFARVHMLP
ncbi:hypothetical protein GIB67_023076 [Kingdonia uniflora]|uniref:Uncharacterized protein n=1 Tax=Kingdonia uniflora TaxID=39325 RepID=A0A7J7P7Z7_9MAGN|nr:hypothetical protein GIB67_023076 [Kingdonia uniflora]